MKRFLIITLILTLAVFGFNCQTKNNKGLISSNNFKSLKYSGVYRFGSYGDTIQTGPGGQVIIYSVSNDSVLFYIDISNGPPSYNMGSLYDKLYIISDKCTFNKKFDYCVGSCIWSFVFDNDVLTIKTIENGYDCGFGGNVIADGVYKKISSSQPDYFDDAHGKRIYFAKTKPEEYYK